MTALRDSGKPPKIHVRGLHKAFGKNQVLRGLDLDIAEGESVVVIGGSGTGKSVLLKCILGLLEADAGSIKVDGEEVVGLRNAPEVAREKLSLVGLRPDVAQLFPAELSGGMKKRVGLARAIATDPEIVFFDEPTTGLDPIMGDVINDLIVDVVHRLGATALSITHDMASARKIAHRVAMLHEGCIVWQGPVAEIDTTENPYVRQFVNGNAEGPIKMPVRQA